MFDRLIDVIITVWDKLLPVEVIPYYDRGVRLRLGERRIIKKRAWQIKQVKIFKKPVPVFAKRVVVSSDLEPVLEPGLHWKIPFADEINTIMIKAKTMETDPQTITTKDWKALVVKAVVKYEIKDVVTTLLEVNDAKDAVKDMTEGIIRNAIIKKDWSECNNEELSKEIKNKARNEAEKWGIKILEVTLTDLGEVPSVRLFGSTEKIF